MSWSHPHTDLGNAQWLVATYGDYIRYVPTWKTWVCYDDGRWRFDDTGKVEVLAKRCVSALTDAASAAEEMDGKKSLLRHAAHTATAHGVRSMLELARTEEAVVARP